jgi:flavin reductase
MSEASELHQRFKDSMRCFANSVTVVATSFADQRFGFTSTAVCCVAFDVPTLLVSVNRTASSHDPIERSGRFSVNLLGTGQADIADRFTGFQGHKGEARFAGASWTALDTGAPILLGGLASFDCRVAEAKGFGSHTLFFGRVVAMACDSAGGISPLLYANRAYAAMSALAR